MFFVCPTTCSPGRRTTSATTETLARRLLSNSPVSLLKSARAFLLLPPHLCLRSTKKNSGATFVRRVFDVTCPSASRSAPFPKNQVYFDNVVALRRYAQAKVEWSPGLVGHKYAQTKELGFFRSCLACHDEL